MTTTLTLHIERRPSPMDQLLLVTDGEGTLRALEFADREERMHRLLKRHYGGYVLESGKAPRVIEEGLEAYFAGDLAALTRIPVATGGTVFQREVWQALRTIAPAETLSYGRLAAQLGRPDASRAVGAANGANPIGIVVPCHRVIGAAGDLTGYAGGLSRKRWLLDHERKFCRTEGRPFALELIVDDLVPVPPKTWRQKS